MECPHAAHCPGCPGLGLDYAAQLARKRAALCGALAAYESLAGVPVPALEGAAVTAAYRARAKLVAGPDGELGLYERGTHQVRDIPECRMLRPALAAAATALRRALPAPFPLHAVDLRETDDGVLCTLIVAPDADRAAVRRFAAELRERAPFIVGLASSVREPGSPQLLGQNHQILSGPEAAPHSLPGLAWQLAAHGAFVQAHPEQAARLLGSLIETLDVRLAGLAGRRVLELYAGSGALSLALARRGASLTAVESFAPAAERIAQAARAQSVTLSVRAERAERALGELARSGARFDAVIVNPPRRGTSPAVRGALPALEPAVIAYVSCQPATLARDLDHLRNLGYGPDSVTGWDMLPHSAAVEALAVLSARPPPTPALVHDAPTWLAVLKSPHFAAAELVPRVRSLPGAERAVPLYALEPGTSGLWLFARAPEHVPACRAALAQGELEYVGLVRGIARAKGALNRGQRLRYARRQVLGGHSLLRLRAERAGCVWLSKQLAAIGHPLLGDGRHGDDRSNRHLELRHGLDRPFLHVTRVTLDFDGRTSSPSAPLPADLAAVLHNLGSRPDTDSALD